MGKLFQQAQREAIAAALGDSVIGLTGREIAHALNLSAMSDPDPKATKRHRIHNAFVASQNARGDRGAILKFIRTAMKPERHLRSPETYEPLRTVLNRALAFSALAVDETGELVPADQATTLTEAEQRANDLRADLVRREVHADVLRFCRSELLADNYFHAVQEAVKSVADKIRNKTGLTDDGAVLVGTGAAVAPAAPPPAPRSTALGGDLPMLAVNALLTEPQKGEQRGFATLVKGVFGMFRNPTAHAPRIQWEMAKEDAEDLLSMASLIHRRLDAAVMPPRA